MGLDLIHEDQIGKAAAEAFWAKLKLEPLVLEAEALHIQVGETAVRLDGRLRVRVAE